MEKEKKQLLVLMLGREKDACRTYQDQSVWAQTRYWVPAFNFFN